MQHWRRKTYDFTLTNSTDSGIGGNELDLAADVPDFQMTQGIDDLTNTTRPRPVTRLGSFTQRDGFGWAPGFKRYFEDGNFISIFPAYNAAGNYRLYYTPITEKLARPVTVDFAVAAADTVIDEGGKLAFSFANLDVVSDMVGGTLTVTFDAPNEGFSGVYTVGGVLGSHIVVTTVDYAAGFTNPAAGTATLTYQPTATVAELPPLMSQWALYLKLHASIAIREAQQLEVGDLDRKFAREAVRVKSMSNKRSEGVAQAPRTRATRRGAGGYGWGSY
jgi:hypothetical protein